MNKTNPMSLIDQIRKREQANQAASVISTNENIIKLKAGNNYAFRLLWLPSDKGRLYPMISQYVHHVYNKGVGEAKVYCPTSPYLKGDTPEGYKCPICKEVFELYKEVQTSPSAKHIVDTFRRTMMGFIPVYVVQGPADDKGKVRILQYTKSFHDYFYSKIFGIAPKKRKNDRINDEQQDLENVDDPLNTEAFMYVDGDGELQTSGFNFIVKVSTQKVPINGKMTDVNKYDMSFSRKSTDINELPLNVFNLLNNKLKFDEDFYKESSTEELLTFKNKYMTNDSSDTDNEDDEISSDIDSIKNKQFTSVQTTVNEEDDDNTEKDEILMSTTSEVEKESIEEETVADEQSKQTSKKTIRKNKEIVEEESQSSDQEDSKENVDDFIANLLKGNK